MSKKLSDELRRCSEDDACGDCQYHKPETKFICRGLLQKAYEMVKEYEDLEEQCTKENSWCLRMLLHKWKEFIEDIQELYEYRKLEEQGKLLKLDFKYQKLMIGQEIFVIDDNTVKGKKDM